jgi:hypothetical protein
VERGDDLKLARLSQVQSSIGIARTSNTAGARAKYDGGADGATSTADDNTLFRDAGTICPVITGSWVSLKRLAMKDNRRRTTILTIAFSAILSLGFPNASHADIDFIGKWGAFGTSPGQFSQIGDFGYNGPQDIAIDGSGNVYVTDTGNQRIEKFDASGRFLSMWGSGGSGDGQFGSPEYSEGGPFGISVDASGNLYVSDPTAFRVQKFDPAGRFLLKWGSHGKGDGQFGCAYPCPSTPGDPDGSGVVEPTAVAGDRAGHIYVLDDYQQHVQKFDSSGRFLLKWTTAAYPLTLAVDRSGNVDVGRLYGVDKYSATGRLLRTLDSRSGAKGFCYDVQSIGVDGAGNLYAASCGHIDVYSPRGAHINQIGCGIGDRVPRDGEFFRVHGVGVSPGGDLYVTDSTARVQRFGETYRPAVHGCNRASIAKASVSKRERVNRGGRLSIGVRCLTSAPCRLTTQVTAIPTVTGSVSAASGGAAGLRTNRVVIRLRPRRHKVVRLRFRGRARSRLRRFLRRHKQVNAVLHVAVRSKVGDKRLTRRFLLRR